MYSEKWRRSKYKERGNVCNLKGWVESSGCEFRKTRGCEDLVFVLKTISVNYLERREDKEGEREREREREIIIAFSAHSNFGSHHA